MAWMQRAQPELTALSDLHLPKATKRTVQISLDIVLQTCFVADFGSFGIFFFFFFGGGGVSSSRRLCFFHRRPRRSSAIQNLLVALVPGIQSSLSTGIFPCILESLCASSDAQGRHIRKLAQLDGPRLMQELQLALAVLIVAQIQHKPLA